MKIRAVLKGSFYFGIIVMLPVCVMMLSTSCAWIDSFISKRDAGQTQAVPLKVKVIYDGNGNTGGTTPVDANLYDPGDTVTVLSDWGDLTLIGYTFVGWNTQPDGSGTIYRAGTRRPEKFIIGDGDVILYALWSEDVRIRSGEIYAGSVNGHSVHIEDGGIWDMTEESTLIYLDQADMDIGSQGIVMDSIRSNGYNIYIDEYYDENNLFGLRTYVLPGGGMLMPKFPNDVEADVEAFYYVDGTHEEYLNKCASIDESNANKSFIYVKNGGHADMRHATITTSISGDIVYPSSDYPSRWGIGSILYSCLKGILDADDVYILNKGSAVAGAHALYNGHIRLANSSILCFSPEGMGVVRVTYDGMIDLDNVSIEIWSEKSPLLKTGTGGGTIKARHMEGVAHAEGSPCINVDGYGRISIEESNLTSKEDSVVVISMSGEILVKDSTLTSGTTAIKTVPFGENCRIPGSGTFINTRIISGSEAFYYNGMSADIVVEGGTTIEIPKGCRLIKADSVDGIETGSSEDPDPTNGTFTAKNVRLHGDVELAEDGTMLLFSLRDGTQYSGAVIGASISIDGTSTWNVTATSIIAGIDLSSVSRINCPTGFRVYYDASINDLGTIPLTGGGELVPIQDA